MKKSALFMMYGLIAALDRALDRCRGKTSIGEEIDRRGVLDNNLNMQSDKM